jgi:hypothetical protein
MLVQTRIAVRSNFGNKNGQDGGQGLNLVLREQKLIQYHSS